MMPVTVPFMLAISYHILVFFELGLDCINQLSVNHINEIFSFSVGPLLRRGADKERHDVIPPTANKRNVYGKVDKQTDTHTCRTLSFSPHDNEEKCFNFIKILHLQLNR